MQHNPRLLAVKRLPWAITLAMASLVTAQGALAQAGPAPTPADNSNNTAADDAVQRVIVTTRRSQQSSIDRKKNAATAVDSIVAEDVGSLPDRNVGEALSRMAGISIDRGDYGEGIAVSVRGNSAALTRVEMDGMAVQSAGGSDLNGGGDGRATEFRQLPADLIKSVDVIKGQTADMTEGSLGGGIRIETRTSLEFNKPYVAVRASGTQHSLNEKWTPDLNVIGSRKFFNNRLGVLVNASVQKLDNESHQFQSSANGRDGYGRFIDIDNSPEKTFSFQPGTLDTDNPAATRPTATFGPFAGATPLELLQKSAAAQSKQDCFTAFPVLISTSGTLAALDAAGRTGAINQRSNELLTCLNQWNDYTPQLLRYIQKRQIDERKNLDLRVDFEIAKGFTIYAKGSYNKRAVDDTFATYSLGQIGYNGNAADGQPSYVDTNGVRSARPGSGFYTLPHSYSYLAGNGGPVRGAAVNFDPATAVVDTKHHLTRATIVNGTQGTDQIRNLVDTATKQLVLGGKLRRGSLLAEFLVGAVESDFQRANLRTSMSYNYGPATLSVGPNGVWGFEFPASTNLQDFPAYVATTTSGGNAPLLTRDRSVQWQSPQMRENFERTTKLDLTYALPESVPILTRLKGGINLRRNGNDGWGNGGYTAQAAVGSPGQPGYLPAVTVPSNNFSATLRGCTDTSASSGSATACQYGLTAAAAPSLGSTYVMTPAAFQGVLQQVMSGKATDTRMFNGADGRPGNVVDNWNAIDVLKLKNLLGLPNFDYDCMKWCAGSDGRLYEQPVTRVREDTRALYLMADFDIDRIPFTERALPFGWTVDGNFGYRYVKRDVSGTGSMTFRTISKTAQYDERTPDAPGGIVVNQITRNTTLNASSHVFLPSYNLALWVVPEVAVIRYSAAKSVALPPSSRLVAAGQCEYDERKLDVAVDDDGTLGCSTVGNPDLRGQSNFNQNLAIEWYPNRDSMFTLAAYRQKGRVGPNETAGVFGVPVFAGSSAVNPVTRQPLADILFDYTTYRNGPVSTRTGWEFGTKTAFTFLPSYLRHTGFDANYTRQKSDIVRPYLDPMSGAALPPAGEQKYSFNYALWYDDGKLSARVAVQTVSAIFRCIAPCGDSGTGLNSYPLYNFSNSSALPWNPGSPNWRDRRSFIDGQVSYTWRKNIKLFVEGRNLGKSTQNDLIGSAPFADGTPHLQNYAFAGRRITVGLSFTN